MEHITESIQRLFVEWKQQLPSRIEKLPQSGSDRTYFRIYSAHDTFIATYNLNVKENQTFIEFSNHFKTKQLPVPEIFCLDDTGKIYIQEDLGTESLLNKLEQAGHTEYVYRLFQKSLAALAKLQICGDDGLNYDACLTAKEFGKQAILSDLLYFKYYFLDTLRLPYDKQQMLDDFDALSTYLAHTEHKYFMFRDFQSRNIIVHNDKVSFIDYQGGMKGALQYDVASMLWQAKAELSEEWKDELLLYYIEEVEKILQKNIDKITFISQYNGYVLIRLMQVIGAYGFRGLFERKAHFLSSIPLALRNLKFFLEHKRIGIVTPEFDRVLKLVVSDDIIERFTAPQADENTPLQITINSFSFKKGIPEDDSENGGGFVFDMRGILNPGRFDEYKTLNGKDKPVQDFLEQRTKMNAFLNSVWDLIDITVEDYLTRGFNNLMINFGCTGGQHRSVYAAEQTARHLRNKYKVKVRLNHTNELNWRTSNP
ncbi:MAG: phosphotransferase [Sphingobacteriia bacterium]|nr:phosphotransferase [Sphingobacteriia bacterium]